MEAVPQGLLRCSTQKIFSDRSPHPTNHFLLHRNQVWSETPVPPRKTRRSVPLALEAAMGRHRLSPVQALQLNISLVLLLHRLAQGCHADRDIPLVDGTGQRLKVF